jgi:hypothetical protein
VGTIHHWIPRLSEAIQHEALKDAGFFVRLHFMPLHCGIAPDYPGKGVVLIVSALESG